MPYDGCIGNITYHRSNHLQKCTNKTSRALFTSFRIFMDKPFLSCSEQILWQQHKKWKQKLHVCAKKGEKLYEFPKNYKSKSPVNATHSYTLKQISNWSLYKI